MLHILRDYRFFTYFTWFTRVMLSLAFIPSGYKKLIGDRFTTLTIDNPVGFFFEALYRAGFYWNFLGAMQLLCAILLLIPRTSFLAALIYLPIIINIFIIVTAMEFRGTPIVAGLLLLGNIYLLLWDHKRVSDIYSAIFRKK